MATATKSTEQTKRKTRDGEMTVAQALEDYKWAYEHKRQFLTEADDDFMFALGSQWDDKDLETLRDKGVLPITVNKIKPIIRLLRGTESQGRSDAKAFPEGGEDSIKAEIATRLLKNAMKMDECNYKISETFVDGSICGESWMEPHLDNTRSLITADLKLRKSDYATFVWDPNAKEYDLSDGQFLCKTTVDLTKDQIVALYEDAEDLLAGSEGGKLDGIIFDEKVDGERQARDYGESNSAWSKLRPDVVLFDLLEYYYKKYVDQWYVADARVGTVQASPDKETAQKYAEQFNATDPEGRKTVSAIKRRVPEIWLMAIIPGIETPLANERAWSYPSWKGWPAIPFFAERFTVKVSNSKRHLLVQGIARDIKDLNRELNKRRTQELRHLNQSANSGWLTPQDAWVDRAKVEDLGSAPGVNLEYKMEVGKPERISPVQLSQGHAQAAQEHALDMKEASGINADLLSQEGGQDSGRAIALRQKQGLVMVQGLFDNHSRSKKALYKFILSQLPEIYTVERAVRVCGEAFLKENFMAPVMVPMIDPRTGQPAIDPATGQPAMAPQIDPMTGQPAMQVDIKAAKKAFNDVLSDPELTNYDIAVGETISQDTVALANYLTLMDMAKQGIPIPPDVLVEESLISTSHKAKIKAALERQMAAAQTAPKKPGAANG